MRKLSRIIHLWLSIPSGVLIFLMCITGAILTFENEILHLVHPKRFAVTNISENTTHLTVDELMPMITTSLNEGEEVSSIRMYESDNQPILVSLEGKRGEQIFIDPFSGDLIERVSYSSTFFGKTMLLHRWLMLTGKNMKVGKLIIGISTIALIIIVISGIVIWIPKRKKQLKESLKIKTSKNRFLLDLHKVLGIYSSILLLIMALTGLMWSFPKYNTMVSKLFNATDEQVNESRGRTNSNSSKGSEKNTDINYTAWDKALNNVKTTGMEYKQIQLSKNSISVLPLNAWHPRAMDTYTFDEKSGELTSFTPYASKKRSSKVMSTAYALHTGRFWGFPVKLIYFLVALIGASLPVTGYWLYINKHFKRKRK